MRFKKKKKTHEMSVGNQNSILLKLNCKILKEFDENEKF